MEVVAMLYTRYRPDVNGPAFSKARIERLRADNRMGLPWAIGAALIMAITMLSICGSLFIYPQSKGLMFFASVSLLIMVATFILMEVRREILDQLSALTDIESIELANLLRGTNSFAVLQYALAVKDMGREFNRAELKLIKEFVFLSVSKDDISKAKSLLYGNTNLL
jgi:hypothetical protein